MIHSIIRDFGLPWVINRSRYSIKLRLLRAAPYAEKLFEKNIKYPERIDLFKTDCTGLAAFLEKLPDAEKKKLTDKADYACRGKIEGFSAVPLDYGFPINWQLNPLTGKTCSTKEKWYCIPDFDADRGDIKAVWEISRFSHFVTFARAYLLTGAEKYYDAFSGQLADWLCKNPYSYGANYKCGQECALRMVNALLAYSVFQAEGMTKEKDLENMKELVYRSYRKILSNFFYAYRCIRNDHTFSELLGMITGAWCCNDNRRLSDAYRMLNDVILEQFTEDGGYRPYSFNYERLVLQELECILSIEEVTGFRIAKAGRKVLCKAVRLLYQCMDACGELPNYGQNDGTLIFQVTNCHFRDYSPVLNTMHVLLKGERLFPSGMRDEELIWFSGSKSRGGKLCAVQRKGFGFRKAGYFTVRSSSMWAMIVCNELKSRPAQMDQLHLDLWIQGRNVFCDSGSYSYAEDIGKKLLDAAGHNTVLCRLKPQMNMKGNFLIYDWTVRKQADYRDNYFCGTVISRSGYVHKRSVKLKEHVMIIRDTVKGAASDRFEILFHTPYQVKEKGRCLELYDGAFLLCRMHLDAPWVIEQSYRSISYLNLEAVTCIRVLLPPGRQINETKIIV